MARQAVAGWKIFGIGPAVGAGHLVFRLPGISLSGAGMQRILQPWCCSHERGGGAFFLWSPWKRAVLCLASPAGANRHGSRCFVLGELCAHLGRRDRFAKPSSRWPLFFALSLVAVFRVLYLATFRTGVNPPSVES